MSSVVLDARGTLISVPDNVVKKSPVLTNFTKTNVWKKEDSFFINYSATDVHITLDFINGYGMLTIKIKDILDFFVY